MFNFRIPGANSSRTVVYQFTGLDRRARISDGACREMTNMSSDDTPCLTVREGRAKMADYAAATLLLHKDGKPFVVDGTAVKYDGQTVGAVAAGKKTCAVMNDWIFLWPDKVAFNAATGEFRAMEVHVPAMAVDFTKSTITRKDGQAWPFKAGDGVTISGCAQAYNNRTSVVQEVDGTTLTFYDNVFQYGELGSDESLNTQEWSESAVAFDITVPDLEFVCEKDNRLWGTYDNHICCCKLGDGFNWNVFNGLSTDAFDVSVGSDGDFTGIAGYSNYVLAFKENLVHKVYGTKPSNFTANVSYVEGVQAGCADTLTVYNNMLFYLSRAGVMAYGGGTPELIGEQLNRQYVRAVAGRHGIKYYLCGVDRSGKAEIVVYDTENGIWTREDDTEVVCFSSDGGTLWFVDTAGGLWQCGTDDPVSWSVVFGAFEEVGAEKKRTSMLDLVLTADAETMISVDVQTDGGGWKSVWNGKGKTDDSTIHINHLPVRGHNCMIRLIGTGKMTLHSINRRIREGSWR